MTNSTGKRKEERKVGATGVTKKCTHTLIMATRLLFVSLVGALQLFIHDRSEHKGISAAIRFGAGVVAKLGIDIDRSVKSHRSRYGRDE